MEQGTKACAWTSRGNSGSQMQWTIWMTTTLSKIEWIISCSKNHLEVWITTQAKGFPYGASLSIAVFVIDAKMHVQLCFLFQKLHLQDYFKLLFIMVLPMTLLLLETKEVSSHICLTADQSLRCSKNGWWRLTWDFTNIWSLGINLESLAVLWLKNIFHLISSGLLAVQTNFEDTTI